MCIVPGMFGDVVVVSCRRERKLADAQSSPRGIFVRVEVSHRAILCRPVLLR